MTLYNMKESLEILASIFFFSFIPVDEIYKLKDEILKTYSKNVNWRYD